MAQLNTQSLLRAGANNRSGSGKGYVGGNTGRSSIKNVKQAQSIMRNPRSAFFDKNRAHSYMSAEARRQNSSVRPASNATAAPQRLDDWVVRDDGSGNGGGGGGYGDSGWGSGGGSAVNNADLLRGFNAQKDTIFSTARDAATSRARNARNSILDFVDSLTTGQRTIDNRNVSNEMAKQRGVSDTYSAVGRGIRSGGVTLSSKNASDSSAAGAIARAYGSIGQRELSDIGNQYELGKQEISLSQEDLARQRASGLRRIDSDLEDAVLVITSDAENKLAALDAAMAGASLPDRIEIDAEKRRIKSSVMEKLAGLDEMLRERAGKVRALGGNEVVAEATRRSSLGMAPDRAFEYDSEAPAEFQNTGPFASPLPIFTYRGRDEEV